jgi:hypothetical protein
MIGVLDRKAVVAGELCPVARDRGAPLEFGARKLLVPVDGERHICAHVVGVVGVFAGVRVVAWFVVFEHQQNRARLASRGKCA